jgi:hypothetical protein
VFAGEAVNSLPSTSKVFRVRSMFVIGPVASSAWANDAPIPRAATAASVNKRFILPSPFPENRSRGDNGHLAAWFLALAMP